MNKIKPFLKWAGSKYRCLDTIMGSLPQANRLIEPFTGSAVIFLNADFSSFLLAEENNDLIQLFKLLQNEGESFINYCEQYFSPANNSAAQYYFWREEFNKSQDTRQKAALFLYLNRHGYNGLCRYNQKGIYNVPFGRYLKPYFPRAEMLYFHQKSQFANFVHGDFRCTMANAEMGDLIYCDPPYVPRKQVSNFTSYTHKKFGEEEQILLVGLAMDCAARGIPVVISNHDTPFTRHHYRYGEITSFPVSRSISCIGSNRTTVKELVAIFRPSRFT
jgi:DNA adenine methylase